MLEGGGVEDDVGALVGEHPVQRDLVAHIAQHVAARRAVRAAVQLLADAVEVELGILEQHQPGRGEAADLAGQFRADRAPGAGDQHALTLQQLFDGAAVQHRLRPSEQVGQIDRPINDRLRGAMVAEIDQARQAPQGHAVA